MALLCPGDVFDRFANSSTVLVVVALLLWVLIVKPIYLLYFHPLSKFPGPRFWAVTRWGVSRAIISGKSHDVILNLHKKYGPIVRVAPDELAFQSVSAWTDIGGHRKLGQAEMSKEPIFNEAFKDNLLGVRKREDHGRMRRILSRGFSASTMQKQEPFLKRYVDQLISELHKRCDDGKTLINLEAWYSFTAFDIIGDLTFGESFGSLDSGGHHPWASLIFDTTRFVILANCLKRINRIFLPLLLLITPKGLGRRLQENQQLTDAKIAKRRALGATRPDYMTAMVGNDKNAEFLSDVEITSNCTALILGGAETISSALSGTTYYLATNPSILAKAVEEVRSAFSREEGITLTGTGQLKYLNAVITEALRMFPPFAGVSPRQVPVGGATIAREFIPTNRQVREHVAINDPFVHVGPRPAYRLSKGEEDVNNRLIKDEERAGIGLNDDEEQAAYEGLIKDNEERTDIWLIDDEEGSEDESITGHSKGLNGW
ncbi:hypothetical protein VE03_05919 [Pseudogymnoascus sp. 23342-1-I1]|nr:hypothetical protein VE03_05919 [Pseudogymnoascus sp. 23342-1-I1]